jgi:hypothetical protein
VQADSYAAMALVLDELERRLSARLAGTTGPVAAAGLVLIYALLPYVVRAECPSTVIAVVVIASGVVTTTTAVTRPQCSACCLSIAV